jgi:phosphatidylserine/phosphatidylglycerophosphate/cardiolipin synthase-like enzyme
MTMVDRRAAYLGTANLTHRGLRDNLEVGVIFRDDTVDQIARFVEEILASRYLHEVETDGEDFKRV